MASHEWKRQFEEWIHQNETETIIYRPGSGRGFSLEAVVDRLGRQQPDHVGIPVFIVKILNDSEGGLELTGVDRGSDTIQIPELFGDPLEDAPERKAVIQSNDRDFITFEVA